MICDPSFFVLLWCCGICWINICATQVRHTSDARATHMGGTYTTCYWQPNNHQHISDTLATHPRHTSDTLATHYWFDIITLHNYIIIRCSTHIPHWHTHNIIATHSRHTDDALAIHTYIISTRITTIALRMCDLLCSQPFLFQITPTYTHYTSVVHHQHYLNL